MKKHDGIANALSEQVMLSGTQTIDVRGCGGILRYSESEIRLSMRTYVLKITGSELFCASYLWGTVRVEGNIATLTVERRGG